MKTQIKLIASLTGLALSAVALNAEIVNVNILRYA